jgi:hypothetical protein
VGALGVVMIGPGIVEGSGVMQRSFVVWADT